VGRAEIVAQSAIAVVSLPSWSIRRPNALDSGFELRRCDRTYERPRK
jgi:hypothetical protein